MHPSFTLQIGNDIFTPQKLKDVLQSEQLAFGEAWQKSVFRFLKQWFSEEDDISVHTSGSTGKPQVIHLSKSLMKESAAMTCDYFGLKPMDRALLCLSAEKIAGMMMLVRAIERGLQLVAVNPVGCPLSIINERVKFAAMVPIQVQHCLDKKCLDKTEILLIGGVAVSDHMQTELSAHSVRCYSSYGMTETMSHVAIKTLNGPDASEWYEGLDGISFSLDDRGCLQIAAKQLGVDQLQTNDMCELNGDTRFRWIGRLDFVINSGGIKVHPEKLEKLLSPCIPFPFFITGLENERLGEKVVIFIQASSVESIPVNEIRQLILEWPKYQQPKDSYFIPEFVFTLSGKIDRNATKTKARHRII
jgi:O-succinylbenzoic acid--CoA ligase